MKKMKLFCLVGILLLSGCKSYRLSDKHETLAVNEIIYTRNGLIDSIRITNKIDIEQFVAIILNAKRSPVKFIALERFDFQMPDDEVIQVNRNDKFISFNGLPFVLSKKDNDQLNTILEKYKIKSEE